MLTTVCPRSSDEFHIVTTWNGSLLPGHTISFTFLFFFVKVSYISHINSKHGMNLREYREQFGSQEEINQYTCKVTLDLLIWFLASYRLDLYLGMRIWFGQKPDPWLCTSNEGRFLKVSKTNVLDNFKTLLSCFHNIGVRRTINVVDSENQLRSGGLGLTGDGWHQKYETYKKALKMM